MTFEQWFKSEHGSYIMDSELVDDYDDHLAQWKVEKLLRQAFEAGYSFGYDNGLDDAKSDTYFD